MIYVQVQGKYLIIVTLHGENITFRGNLTQTMQQLEPNGFIRINQSEAVNERYVLGYNCEQVRLRGGTQLTISQRRQKAVLRQLKGERS